MSHIAAHKRPVSHRGRILFNVIVLTLLLLCAATQWRHFVDAVRILGHGRPDFVIGAISLLLFGCMAAALSYVFLADSRRVYLRQTFLVQLACGLTNRLLPVGIGSLGLYGLYLRGRGLSVAKASAVVATNGSLGIAGNLTLLAVVLAGFPDYFDDLHWPAIPPVALYAGAVGIIVLVAALLVFRSHDNRRVWIFLSSAWKSFKAILRPSRRSVGGLLCNMTLTAVNTSILVCSAAALGFDVSWPYALLTLSLGTLAGAVVPTPGGLGGVEAGQYASLVAYGLPPSESLAIIVLYRSITYWLPIIPGLIFLPIVRRRYL